MCYARPRPRCSDHVQQKVNSRMTVWEKRKNELGPSHPKTLAAKALLQTSIKELDTTEGGLKNLREQLELEPNNTILLKRLNTGETANQLRTLAGKELDQQRPQALGTLFSEAIPYYDYAETKSIIDSTIEHNIQYASNQGHMDSTPISREEYDTFLNNLETRIIETKGELTERDQNTLNLLREQDPPAETAMQAYRNIDRTLLTGKKQLEQEIIRTAAIQGVHPRTLAAFYEGYRKQYNENYKHLDPTERPDPPQHWIEGDLSGYRKTKNTAFAPNDPASLYAIYRLRTDPNAIPANFKPNPKNLVSVNLITADLPDTKAAREGNTPIIGISMTEYSPDGKELNKNNTWIRPPANMPKKVRDQIVQQQGIDPDKLESKPRWADVRHVIAAHLDKKTLIVSGGESTLNTLRKHMTEDFRTPSVIDINDTAGKQFSQHDTSLATSVDTLGLSEFSYNTKKNTESLLIGEAFFTQQQKMRASWDKKEQRKNAPVLTSIPHAGRWAKNDDAE